MSAETSASPLAIAQPFLRWAGSKRKLLPILGAYWRDSYSRYVEPFAGSACLYFSIRPAGALLSDANPHLIRTYEAIKRDPASVFAKFNAMPRSSEYYYSIREKALDSEDEITLAANFLYLNRNCFNGIYRTNKSGRFNVPYSSRRTGSNISLPELQAVSAQLRGVVMIHGDFQRVLQCSVRQGDFVYLDPPFALKNARIFTQYGPDTFGTNDLERLAAILRTIDSRGATFVLSYADCPEAREAFREWSFDSVSTARYISGFAVHRRTVQELVFTNGPGRADGSSGAA